MNLLKRDIADYQASGSINYPFLGVRYSMITPQIQSDNKLPVSDGALLLGDESSRAIVEGSPADIAGLKDGDIIINIDGSILNLTRPLGEVIQKYKPGDTVTLYVLRASGKYEFISVRLETYKTVF